MTTPICTPEDYMYRGFYPRLYDQRIEPCAGLPDYIETYIERDLLKLSRIQDLLLFRKFLQLCAGRTGQILNFSHLAEDTGISHKTAAEWISLLETSFIVFRLPPYFANISKRLIKSPKLYFHDSIKRAAKRVLIYDGDRNEERSSGIVTNLKNVATWL